MITIRRVAAVLAIVLLAATYVSAQTTTPTATNADSLTWDYTDSDLTNTFAPVALFLVCMDGQPTANCTRVPATGGVTSTLPPTSFTMKTFTWKFPALVAGPHTVAVQACTANAAECSSGISLAFIVKLTIANPMNLRLTKIGG